MADSGFECILKVGGDTVGAARDVDPTLEADEHDITTRSSAPWDDWKQGRKRLTADITALWVPTAAALTAIEDAWFNDDDLTFEITNSDGSGYSGTCGVLDLNPGPQDMDGEVDIDISIKSRGQVSQTGGS